MRTRTDANIQRAPRCRSASGLQSTVGRRFDGRQFSRNKTSLCLSIEPREGRACGEDEFAVGGEFGAGDVGEVGVVGTDPPSETAHFGLVIAFPVGHSVNLGQ
jgi:hypothetical protein